ncbi:solute carrier family 23 protein, partial [Lysinibacillus fusiformis]|uniref:solute carrier family 23 protein n=1 Tax=Lysinibacillus fusiformis TaxID=28031 RepID=UPI0023ED7D84
ILIVYDFATGFVRAISILIGLVVGTVLGAFMDKVDFKPVADANVIHMVQPLYFGMPTFDETAIITMTLEMMVSLV